MGLNMHVTGTKADHVVSGYGVLLLRNMSACLFSIDEEDKPVAQLFRK